MEKVHKSSTQRPGVGIKQYTVAMERKVIALQAKVLEMFSELVSLNRETLDLEMENVALKEQLEIAGQALLAIQLKKEESDREVARERAQYLQFQQLPKSGQQHGASRDRAMEKVHKSSTQRPSVGIKQCTAELERKLTALKPESAEMFSKLESLERKTLDLDIESLERKTLDLDIESAALKESLERAKQASLAIQRESSLPFISLVDTWKKVEKEESDREVVKARARARASAQALYLHFQQL